MCLFAGARARGDRFLIAVPFVALFLSDLVLGFHPLMPFVYGAYAITVGIGAWWARRGGFSAVVGSAIVSSLLFFWVTNVGAWLFSATGYPRSPTGFIAALSAGVPFWRPTLVADLGFCGLLFGLDALLAPPKAVMRGQAGTL